MPLCNENTDYSSQKSKPKKARMFCIFFFYTELYRRANKNKGARLVSFLFHFFSPILCNWNGNTGKKKKKNNWDVYFQSSIVYHADEVSQLAQTLQFV